MSNSDHDDSEIIYNPVPKSKLIAKLQEKGFSEKQVLDVIVVLENVTPKLISGKMRGLVNLR